MRKLIKWLSRGDEETVKEYIRDNLNLHIELSEECDKFQTLTIGLSIKGDARTFSTIYTSIPRYDLECFKEETEE